MNFEFATAGRILFGPGYADNLPLEAARIGNNALVVTGNSTGRWGGLISALERAGLACRVFPVHGEPTVSLVRQALVSAREGRHCDMVIAIGGGSVMDTGKAVAALLTNTGQIEDYLEVVGQGKPLTERPAPCIALPTTAGTGAEVTRNAVLGVPEKRVKVSLRSPLMLPALAIVDPLLTHSLPPEVTAHTGMDALTQLLEAYVSRRANPFTDCLCSEGLIRVGRSLERAWRNGADAEAREDMALAALFGGLALANAGLGAVHGLAGPLGGMLDAPHGAVCAALLPAVTRANITALGRSGPEERLERYRKAFNLMSGDSRMDSESASRWEENLVRKLNIAGLNSLGLERKMIPEAVEKSLHASSMKGNPVELSAQELTRVLVESL